MLSAEKSEPRNPDGSDGPPMRTGDRDGAISASVEVW